MTLPYGGVWNSDDKRSFLPAANLTRPGRIFGLYISFFV